MKFFSFLICLCLVFACSDVNTELENRSFHLADSIFNAHNIAYQYEADSLCKALEEHKMSFLVDSIIEVRRAEIKLLRKL